MSDRFPLLYSFRRCPYAMRARMALAVSGQTVELREIELRNRPDEIYAASAKGTVPVLVLPEGEVIDESLDVMRWALAQNDPEAWLPSDASTQAETESLVARNDREFKHHLDRYKYATRYEDVDEVEHRDAASLVLRELDARLQQNAFLLGDQFQFVDAALAPFVRQFAIADRAWFDGQDWTELRAWLDAFIASERFQSIMQKYPVWQPEADPLQLAWK
jgi:glutathione S-transferase